MPCYTPLNGYVARRPNPTGKRSIVFNHRDGYIDLPMQVPCGQCIGCRLERSRQWAMRCVHEASLYEDNCFITLTFNDKHLQEDRSLCKKDFQLFMKRLRKKFSIPEGGSSLRDDQKIRYYHCGEYGENFGRPHHHACLFNFDFPDKEFISCRDGINLYRSDMLEELWPYGYSTIGNVTFESAAYVARYIMKKITGEKAEEHYKGREKEYTTMSRRPGLGRGWIEKFQSDVYPHDRVILRGDIQCKPPKYYDSIYDIDNHDILCILKGKRERRAKKNPNTKGGRLIVKHKVKQLAVKQLKRGLL